MEIKPRLILSYLYGLQYEKLLKKFILSNTSLYIYGIALVLILWYFISLSQGVGNLIFPTPIDVFGEMFFLLGKSYTYGWIGYSLLRTFEGFMLAFIGAIIMGSLAGNFPKLQTVFKPLIIVMKSAPTAAFVFLFLVLTGSSYATLFIVLLLAFPILYDSVVAGITNIDKNVLDALKVDSKNNLKALVKIKIPLSLPYILVGIASSFALSFKTEIMAEIITGNTDNGLGNAIRGYRNLDPSNLTPIFAITLIAIIIILLVDLLGYFTKKHFDKIA